MIAPQAKALADKANTESTSEEFTRIMLLIKNAAGKGHYSVSVKNLSNTMEQKLKEMGYKLHNHTDIRDVSDCHKTISWNG